MSINFIIKKEFENLTKEIKQRARTIHSIDYEIRVNNAIPVLKIVPL